MANIKSAKKRAVQNRSNHQSNLARKTAIKTAIKKVLLSLEQGDAANITTALLRSAESKIARAKRKTMHVNTACRKISSLARKVAVAHATR